MDGPLRVWADACPIDSVVVHRRRALVARTTALLLPCGEHAVRVGRVASAMVPNSLAVAAAAATGARAGPALVSVRVASVAVRPAREGSPSVEPEERELCEEREQLEDTLAQLTAQRERCGKRRDWLDGWARETQSAAAHARIEAPPASPALLQVPPATPRAAPQPPAPQPLARAATPPAFRSLSPLRADALDAGDAQRIPGAYDTSGAAAAPVWMTGEYLKRVGAFLDFYEAQLEALEEREATIDKKYRETEQRLARLLSTAQSDPALAPAEPRGRPYDVDIVLCVTRPQLQARPDEKQSADEGPQEEAERAQVSLRFSYVVDGASWSPEYDTRAQSTERSLQVAFYAVVANGSGEDWQDAQISLSTASSPPLAGQAPAAPPAAALSFAPLTAEQAVQQQQRAQALSSQSTQAKGAAPSRGLFRRESFTSTRSEMEDLTSESPAGFSMMMPPGSSSLRSLQNPGFVVPDATLDSASACSPDTSGELDDGSQHSATRVQRASILAVAEKCVPAVLLPLARRCSIPGGPGAAPLRTAVASVALEVELAHVLVPRATHCSCVRAAITNGAGLPLLAGPASVFVDGVFTCSSAMPDVMPSERFVLLLGNDALVTAEYRPVEQTRDNQGGWVRKARVVERFTRTIVIRNARASEVLVELQDQIPVSTDDQIRVALLEPEPAAGRREGGKGEPREAREPREPYVSTQYKAETGTVTWVLRVPPNKTMDVPLRYTVDWPATRSVVCKELA
eukprot:m51a1_g1845 hypothetical protein (744) ;mRNA; r:580412-583310